MALKAHPILRLRYLLVFELYNIETNFTLFELATSAVYKAFYVTENNEGQNNM